MAQTHSRATRTRGQSPVAAALTELEALRVQFDRAAGARKLQLLRALRAAVCDSRAQLEAYHDLLCFMRAYPQSAAMLKASEAELQSFAKRVAHLKSHSRDPGGRRLVNSGWVDTAVVHPYTYEAIHLLLKKHRGRLDFSWGEISDAEQNKILEFLPHLIGWQESDALDYDQDAGVRDWLRRAADRRAGTDLEGLIGLLAQSELPRTVQRHVYDQLEFPVRWELGRSTASRTLQRFPARSPFFQNEPRRTRTRDLRTELAKPPTPLVLLSPREGARYVRAIQEVMYVRYRELFPITFANPNEVYRNRPGRGLEIFLFGMLPQMRLPLEANFGALLLRNGMPVGYGIGAPLGFRTEIAINIFPAFRAGESAYIFEEFFRIFHHHFGCGTFIVRSHQMGEDDDEPLLSGAFWFYYKLGFRATNPRVRRLAERMAGQLAQRPKQRFSLAQLKRLAHTDVYFHADPREPDRLSELSYIDLSYAVTDYFARRCGGDRQEGTRMAVKEVRRALGLGDVSRWTPDQRVALERLAPLLVNIRDLPRWPQRDKSDLVRLIRAKGGPQERQFVLRLQRHVRLRDALNTLARRARGPRT